MGLDLGVDDVREHARNSALAGREIFCNPHLGDAAVLWFDAYRDVPEDQRGSRPDLLPRPSTVRRKRKARGLAVTASPKTATPRPWSGL
jgi:hypothetical protein